MTRATITRWDQGSSYGFAATDSGVRAFIHETNLPRDAKNVPVHPALDQKIELDLIEGRQGAATEWAASNVRFIEDAPSIAPARAPSIVPAPPVMAAPEEIPHAIAVALGLLDEPEPRKRTKRDRVRS